MIPRKKVLIVLILTLFNVDFGMSRALRGGIDFQDCGSKYDIVLLDISSCDSLPCVVERGYFITVTFEMDQNSDILRDALSFEAYWLIGGTQYNAFILPDYCTLGDCLSVSGQRMRFSVSLYVSDIAATMSSGSLIWRTRDFGTKDLLTCSRVPIFIM